MSQLSKIKYGSVICLKHVSTGAFLKSLRKACCHPGTSTQQMVVASLEKTEDTHWLIKGEDKLGNNYPIGEDVAHGHRIRLEHRSTGSNLHSHGDRLSPVTKQQEVTCYGINGKGDFRDDWFVDIQVGGPWYFDQRVRLVHADTKRPLHSHNKSDPIFTNGEQEVTCFDDPKWDDNDLWVVESTDQRFRQAGEHSSKEKHAQDAPSISEPWKWACYHIEKDWHIVTTAKLAFVLIGLVGIVLGGSGAWWFLSQRIADRDETIAKITRTKDATIEAKQAIIDQKQTLLDDARQENERLTKQLAGGKTVSKEAVQNEMTVTFHVQNLSTNKLEINPVCSISITESFAGRTSWFNDEAFRLSPIGSTSSESEFSIPPDDSRDYSITVPDDDQHRIVFIRGAGTLSFQIYVSDGSRSVKGEMPFNKDFIHSKKAIVKF
jgi:hypothetical protein